MTDKFLRYDHYSEVGDEWPLEHFSPEEVSDSRDGSVVLYVPFGERMDRLREQFGSAIIVNSWYRTPEHDIAIGGKGAHRDGWAADIKPANDDWSYLCFLAGKYGFLGFGDNIPSFIHLDDSQTFWDAGKRPAHWKY